MKLATAKPLATEKPLVTAKLHAVESAARWVGARQKYSSRDWGSNATLWAPDEALSTVNTWSTTLLSYLAVCSHQYLSTILRC